ncbi:hypothetical protein ACFFRR_003239 [Megaselia abdita]
MVNTMATYISQDDFQTKLSDYLDTRKPSEVHTRKDIRRIIRCLQKKTSKIKLYSKKYQCDPTKTVLLLKSTNTLKSIPIVPREDYFQTLYEAHILSGHSGSSTMIKQLKLYCCVPDFVVDIFVDCCVVCLEEKREQFLSLVKSKQCACVNRVDFDEKLSKFLNERTEIGFKFIAKADLNYLVKLLGSSESQDDIGDEPLEYKLNEHSNAAIYWRFDEDNCVEVISYEDLFYYLTFAHETSQHGGFVEMKVLLDSKYFIPNRAVRVFLELASCQPRRSEFHQSQSVSEVSYQKLSQEDAESQDKLQSKETQNNQESQKKYASERSQSLFPKSQERRCSRSSMSSDIKHEGQRFNCTSDFDYTPQNKRYSQSPRLELNRLEDFFDVDRILESLDTRPDLQLRTPTPIDKISVSSEASNFFDVNQGLSSIVEKEPEELPPKTPFTRTPLSVYDPLNKDFNDEGEILLIKLRSTLNVPGLLLYRDLATEFTVLRVLKNSCSRADIAIELWKTFSNFGFPGKFQTEGTKEFTLDIIEELYKLYPDNGVTMNHNAVKRPIYNRKTKDQIRFLIDQWLVDNQSNDLDMACHKVQWMINTSKKVFYPCPFSGVFRGKSGFVHENPNNENFFKTVGFTHEKLSQTDFLDTDNSSEE